MQALQPITQSTLENPPNDDVPVNPAYRPCQNRPIGQPDWKLWAPEGGWACDQSKVDFPTVECLVADMKSCGNIGDNTVFYSFGASTPDARAFRDTLQPQGTMFNDALDDYYSQYIINKVDKFGLWQGQVKGTSGLNTDLNRNDIFTGRYCEAMATASSGTAYLVVLNYNGDSVANQGGKPGIFQNPLPNTGPNQWRRWEFGTLQQNAAIMQIVSIDLAGIMTSSAGIPPYTQHVDWTSNGPGKPITDQQPTGNAGQIPLPPILANDIRDKELVELYRERVELRCVQHPLYPQRLGQLQRHQRLPHLVIIKMRRSLAGSSGAVTPNTVITPITTELGLAITNSAACSVCSPYALNGLSCTSIPNCQQHTPSAFVQAGNQSVHVGTLTSMDLSSSISNALASLCPTVTQTTSMTNCDSDTVKIPDVVYKEQPDGTISKGELDVSVKSSQYNDTRLRKAMIDAAALTAMQSATGNNCYDEEYTVLKKRSLIPSVFRRWLLGREGAIEPISAHMTMCVASSFAGVQYFPEYWGQAQDPENEFMWLDAEWDFVVPPSVQLTCEFIAGLVDALVLIAPEFAPEDVALGEEIDAACAEAMTYLNH
ncbi:hypothetical protein OEA41_009105 [Lepraria neglecta]|uniref:Uncharacterized protein n=1 Tax=Lepraria neglecta TaxID=209136 RepID=A0AAE0DHC6_9LECA|nr:hypothetical protein OEA41_009105 [Lepraria neglecta]